MTETPYQTPKADPSRRRPRLSWMINRAPAMFVLAAFIIGVAAAILSVALAKLR